MDLVLDREYWPGGTNGSLLCNGNILSHTAELPVAHFRQPLSCIPEGIYELELVQVYTHQKINLFKTPNGIRSPLRPEVEIGIELLHRNIILVSEITGEGRGVPSPKALAKLLHLVDQALKRGEKATLEIRSYPEHALNLTCHQIEWMD